MKTFMKTFMKTAPERPHSLELDLESHVTTIAWSTHMKEYCMRWGMLSSTCRQQVSQLGADFACWVTTSRYAEGTHIGLDCETQSPAIGCCEVRTFVEDRKKKEDQETHICSNKILVLMLSFSDWAITVDAGVTGWWGQDEQLSRYWLCKG